jgi:uncharacterized protein
MLTSEVDFSGRLPVEGYGPGFFRVAGSIHEGPLALLPSGPRPWGGLDDMAPFLVPEEAIDVLLVGTGPEIAFLPPDVHAMLEAAGLGVEAMATASACRSYNVLLAEERRVAAALLPL